MALRGRQRRYYRVSQQQRCKSNRCVMDIVGYASIFDTPDAAGDVVKRGAFLESLKTRPAHLVRMFFQHDQQKEYGYWSSLEEDDRGLLAHGLINENSEHGAELASLVSFGSINGLSIGFKTISSTLEVKSKNRILTEIDLREISIVLFPMHEGSRMMRPATLTLETDNG